MTHGFRSDTTFESDVLVVGAGAVGLACGYAFSKAGAKVIVIEKGSRIGEGVSSRNSEVVHAGLYYPTDSLKARLCVEGRRLLYSFLDSHGVRFKKCGKLVVANGADEISALERVYLQAKMNQVEGLKWLEKHSVTKLEPLLKCDVALYSTESGVFDSHGYMLALQGEIEQSGGLVVCNSTFDRAVRLKGGGWQVFIADPGEAAIKSRLLVTAAGLDAQKVAARLEGFPTRLIPGGYLGKGVYFRYNGKPPFSRLVYPTPIPGALGTHYRVDLSGRAILGPDLDFVASVDYSVDAGRAETFLLDVRRYWPSLEPDSLTPDYAGIRPKLHGPGEPQPDFEIMGPDRHGLDGLAALFGIESPGLTSSIAVGRYVENLLRT
jgi:L-2-hydroxyglutarate oxidase LhgO